MSAPPASAPAPTSTAPNTTSAPPSTPAPQTFLQKLSAAEQDAIWKLSLRVILIVTAIIGSSCFGWAVSNAVVRTYRRELDSPWQLFFSFITFGVSAVWCAVCILVLLLRRPHAPVHPGVAVGMDLVLWLAFIPTALIALASAINVLQFGSNGIIGEYSSYGSYSQAANGTWVWNESDDDSYWGRGGDCSRRGGRSGRYFGYGFDSCAGEDAYVNALWAAKPRRAGVEVTGVVCQFIGLLLHLTLFVWACVDTYRRRRCKVSKDAERLAADIVMNMVSSGAVIRARGQGPMQQRLLHPQYPQNGPPGNWPLPGPAPMGKAPPGGPMMPPPQPVVLRPEKGEASRFA